MGFFSRTKELDSKSMHISIMYLCRAKTELENELKSGERLGETESWVAEHDIKCIERAIEYLEG